MGRHAHWFALLAIVAGCGGEPGKAARPIAMEGRFRPELGTSFAGLVIVTSEGADVRELHVREVRAVPGRIGFFRIPLLDGVELRGVRWLRNGEVVTERERLPIAPLGAPPPAALRAELEPLLAILRPLERKEPGVWPSD